MRGALVILLFAANAVADVPTAIRALDPEGTHDAFEALLWDMARDADFAAEVYEMADGRSRALTDTLVQFVSMTETEATAHIDSLAVPRDRSGRDRPAPLWSEVQWQGVQLLRRIAPDASVARDVRFRREMDQAMDGVTRPQRAAVRGVVEVARQWWAERGENPELTHDPTRIPDIDTRVARLDLAADDPEVWAAPGLLADLDADLVLHVRVARRLDPDRHAHLVAELVQALRSFPEDFTDAGIAARRWDASRGRTVGHNAADLWAIALELLERCTGRFFSGPDDTIRRLAALGWWEGAQYEARFWRDPTDAPTLARFLEDGLVGPDGRPRRAAVWAREVYLERGVRDLVVDRLGPPQRNTVAELIALLPMPAADAHAAGFAQAYRSDVVDQPGVTRRVAVDWDAARDFLRRMLTRLTGVEEPAGVASLEPGARASFWLDWWAAHRDEPQWSRPGFVTPSIPSTTDRPLFEPRRGRID